MTDADRFTRPYLFVDVHQPATTATVAALFEAAAASLRASGEVDVQHVAFETDVQSQSPTTSLTVYYDRVERRRRHRDDDVAHGDAGQRSLRSVE